MKTYSEREGVRMHFNQEGHIGMHTHRGKTPRYYLSMTQISNSQ